MWNNLKSTDLINDSMYYGETICQLSIVNAVNIFTLTRLK